MRHPRQRKLLAALVGAVGTLATVTALAADFTDWAPVVSSRPVRERISEPRQECSVETVTTNEVHREGGGGSSPIGAIIGGIAGGVLGHQVGGGRGRDVATAAGAVAGAAIGNNIDNDNREPSATYVTPTTRDVKRCRTVESFREVVRGYDVVYRYNGHDVPVRLSYDPGPRVRIGVSMVQ